VITKHRSKEMVPIVSLADNQEHQETTIAASASDISNTNASTNPNLIHAQQRARAAPPGKMEHASAPLSLIADPASYVSPPMPLPPHIDNKIGAPPSLDITINTPQAIPNFNADPDHTTEWDVDATSGKIDCGSATPPPIAASTCHHTPARDLLPLVDYNTGTTMYSSDTTDTDSLLQLHLAVTDDCELQIIFTTVEDHAAAPAWSL
jgi:hypothetical protein